MVLPADGDVLGEDNKPSLADDLSLLSKTAQAAKSAAWECVVCGASSGQRCVLAPGLVGFVRVRG